MRINHRAHRENIIYSCKLPGQSESTASASEASQPVALSYFVPPLCVLSIIILAYTFCYSKTIKPQPPLTTI